VLTVMVQIRYLKTIDMGYNREHVLGIPNFLGDRDDVLKPRLQSLSSVLAVGRSNRLMGQGIAVQSIPEGSDPEKSVNWALFFIDEDFFKTLDIPVLQGRAFSKESATDAEEAIIINEAAQRITGWDNPINRRVDLVMDVGGTITKRIIGVVKDFHFDSPRRPTDPMVFQYTLRRSPLLMARLAPGKIVEARNEIEAIHNELFPDRDFNAFFIDEVFDRQFNDDREFASYLGFFSSVAIFIACLGLIGLVSFAVEQRRKEIAIRKVLGCSEKKITVLLAVDFLKWICIANLIAWPAGYFSMQKWLEEFTYRVPFTIVPFIISGAGALIVAMLTMTFQSIKAARTNPANVLRQDM
jgi:putative ABC transport system permease protein